MAIEPRDFWNRLVKSGITDERGVRKLAVAVRKADGGEDPSDVRRIAKRLVKSGILTTYQAQVLLSERPKSLRRDQWLVQDAQCASPLTRWLPVRSADGKRQGALFVAKSDDLTEHRRQWLEVHQSIREDTLQSIEVSTGESNTVVFSDLPAGGSLHDRTESHRAFSSDRVGQIGRDLCQALHALHARNLVHGQLRSDRVWIGDDQQVTLLRDPSGPPPKLAADNGNPSNTQGWLDEVEDPLAYLAPELADPQQSPTAASDIYSLGALLYRLRTGRNAVQKESFEEALHEHATIVPPELAEAVEAGAAGDPLFRVIAFAMAKRPEARFATADQFGKALQAILPLLAQGDQTASAAEEPAKPAVDDMKQLEARTQNHERQLTGNLSVKESSATLNTDAKTASTFTGARGGDAAEAKKDEPPVPAAANFAGVKGDDVAEAKADEPPVPVATDPLPAVKEDSGPPVASTETPVADSKQPRRRRKRKKNQAVLILGGMCIAVLMLMIVLVSGGGLGSSDSDSDNRLTQRTIPTNIPPVTRRGGNADDGDDPSLTEDAQVEGYELVADDRLLFVPPYAATTEPSSLELLPPGPAIIATFRLAELLNSDAGEQLIEAFSPGTTSLLDGLQSRTGVEPSKIKRCTIAMFSGSQGWPEVSLAIELSESSPKDDLLKRWEVSEARTPSGATIYAGDEVDSDAYFFADPEAEAIDRFAVGSIERIQEVGENEGGAIPLPRALQTLWNASSEDSHIAILATPNFLFADGRELLQSGIPEAVGSFKRFLIPDVAAALLTATVDADDVFIETRLAASGGSSAASLSRELQAEIDSWPNWAESFIVDSVPDASWRLLAIRLPAMMRFVADQFRYGVSDDAATANAYLPVKAVPQLALAGVLALNTSASPATAVAAAAPVELSVDEMLSRPMTVTFEQESLEFALDAIVNAFNDDLPPGNELPPARIIGGDLQTMGITQNQQVRDFDKQDQPLRSVLTDLVLGANPDKTASGPADSKQALVWVVSDDPEQPGGKAILITTRQAAADKYDLPQEFQSPSSP